MKRYKHWLYPAKGNTQPRGIVCVEVATTTSRPDMGPALEHVHLQHWYSQSAIRVGVNYEKVRHRAGADAGEFWQQLERFAAKHGPVSVFASRAPVVWSALGLWERVDRRQLRLRAGTTNRPAGMVGSRLLDGKSLLVLEDPTNILRLWLPALSVPVMLLDVRNYGLDLVVEEPDPERRRARSYLFVIGMIAALDAGKLGSLQSTVSSQSLYTFRHTFMEHSIHAHTHEQASQLEEDALHGGRCEAYQLGRLEDEVYHLDFSSLYASRCLVEEVPVQLRRYEQPLGLVSMDWGLDAIPDMAEVTLHTSEPRYPFSWSGLTVYPTGSFRTTLCGAELAHAYAHGDVTQWWRAAWYHKRPALAKFAAYFLARRLLLRREGLHDLGVWVKRLLVGLVGKFGQRGAYWVDLPGIVTKEPWDAYCAYDPKGPTRKYRVLSGHRQLEIPQRWGANAVPAISAWIMASARDRLWRALQSAGMENCYYCDTDSIMCNQAGCDKLALDGWLSEDEPGKLRLVDKAQGGTIHGWKSYDVGTRHACSGLPRGTHDEAPSGFYAWFTCWLSAALREKRTPDARRVLVQRRNSRAYRHGVVGEGGRVRPFALPEELNLIKDR